MGDALTGKQRQHLRLIVLVQRLEDIGLVSRVQAFEKVDRRLRVVALQQLLQAREVGCGVLFSGHAATRCARTIS